jgi:hypothetical protein
LDFCRNTAASPAVSLLTPATCSNPAHVNY